MLKLPHISLCEELRRSIGKCVCVCVCVCVPRCFVVRARPTVGGSSDWTLFLFLPFHTHSYKKGAGSECVRQASSVYGCSVWCRPPRLVCVWGVGGARPCILLSLHRLRGREIAIQPCFLMHPLITLNNPIRGQFRISVVLNFLYLRSVWLTNQTGPKKIFCLVPVSDRPCQFMCEPNYFMSFIKKIYIYIYIFFFM